jgi:hypothetical protein
VTTKGCKQPLDCCSFPLASRMKLRVIYGHTPLHLCTCLVHAHAHATVVPFQVGFPLLIEVDDLQAFLIFNVSSG